MKNSSEELKDVHKHKSAARFGTIPQRKRHSHYCRAPPHAHYNKLTNFSSILEPVLAV